MKDTNPLRLSMQYFAEDGTPDPALADTPKPDEAKTEETVAVPKGKFEQFWNKLFGNDDVNKDDSKDGESKANPQAKPTPAPTNVNVDELLKQARIQWEAEQVKKSEFDKLPAEEKAKAEAEEIKAKLADAQRQIETNNLKNEAIAYLQKENYPIELADCLNYSGKEDCEKSLASITAAFEKALESKWKERFAGKTPDGLGKPPGSTASMQSIIAQGIRGGM